MTKEYTSEEIVHMVRCFTSGCIQKMDNNYKEFGVTGIQYFILCRLQDESESKVSELAQGLNVTNSNLSAILKRLEQAGYVKRRRPKEDQRVVYVSLSNKGSALLDEIEEHTSKHEGLLERASEEEKKIIFESLEILQRLIEEDVHEK